MDWSDDYYNKMKTNEVFYLLIKFSILWLPRRSLLHVGHFWICCIAYFGLLICEKPIYVKLIRKQKNFHSIQSGNCGGYIKQSCTCICWTAFSDWWNLVTIKNIHEIPVDYWNMSYIKIPYENLFCFYLI